MNSCLGCGTAVAAGCGVLLGATLGASAQERVNGRPSLVFENAAARVVVDLAGGAIGEFQWKEGSINPLHWATPAPGDTSIRGFGHFLCLDRWGPPSAAEGARGMPYHGEAASVEWKAAAAPAAKAGAIEAEMTARLPKAGLSVRRTLRFSTTSAALLVREEITNENPLGRIYNAVQHPTVGPPFLDETTVVDCNGRRGFAQGGALPNPEEPHAYWPRAINREGASVDLRRLAGETDPNVVSYTIEAPLGWVTAATPGKGVLIGYVWRTRDYPWVSLWRDARDGKPTARGLEFGTTGLHQPFPILVRKGRIWDRPLFEHLDAGETVTKSYASFLLKIPADFRGVESVVADGGRWVVLERGGGKPREFVVDAPGLTLD